MLGVDRGALDRVPLLLMGQSSHPAVQSAHGEPIPLQGFLTELEQAAEGLGEIICLEDMRSLDLWL